ncbi:MAG: hypothetical protein ACK5KL_02350 [Dysgonomonas sp.]
MKNEPEVLGMMPVLRSGRANAKTVFMQRKKEQLLPPQKTIPVA